MKVSFSILFYGLAAGILLLLSACEKEDPNAVYGTFKDPDDGKTYRTIVIGGLEWLADNMNKGKMIKSSQQQTNNEEVQKYCYHDDPKNCDRFGGLYTWDEAMGYIEEPGAQGICPTGWWIPTDANWKELEMSLGMSNQEANETGWRSLEVGVKLKPKGSSNFAGRLSGHRFHANGNFYGMGQSGSWWSSSSEPTHAWRRKLGEDKGGVYRALSSKQYAYSVRCVRHAPLSR